MICTHHIHLEEELRPSREPQRRINPMIARAVKDEILKLLEADIIYPISDSRWVSPIHVVPKKSGTTITKMSDDTSVPSCAQNSWQVCVDYCQLNTNTRKDHFLLPFLDQILERLAGHMFYYFLDGYSVYNQIHIVP